LIVAVDAAGWPWPLGWGYQNLLGNLTASGVCLVLGFVAGSKALKGVHRTLDTHHAAMHARLDRQDETLKKVDAIHGIVSAPAVTRRGPQKR
jgi:hypothetical protein